MDASLLYVGVGVAAAVLLFVLLSRSSSSAASVESLKAKSWRGAVQTIDPVLRNRHGIQNGEIKEWSLSEVAKHNKADDLFMVIKNKVYDFSDFVEDHPGGVEAILKFPGQDNTEGFSGIQHPAKVWDMIHDYYVGEVKKEEQVEYTFKQVSKM